MFFISLDSLTNPTPASQAIITISPFKVAPYVPLVLSALVRRLVSLALQVTLPTQEVLSADSAQLEPTPRMASPVSHVLQD